MTVRFDRTAYEIIRNEAERSGITVAQFVREAAMLRAVMRALVAEHELPLDRSYVQAFHRVSEEVVRLSRVDSNNAES